MCDYAFIYLRTDEKRTTLGPFSKEEAEQKRAAMVSLRATCSQVYLLEEGQREKIQQNDYFRGKIASFESYLQLELQIFDHEDIGRLLYSYLKELPDRILRFAKENAPYMPKESHCHAFDQADRCEYLYRIATILKIKSSRYKSTNGIQSKDIGRVLENIATLVAHV